MADGEQMRLTIDFETNQALANAIALALSIRDAAEAFGSLDTAVTKTESSLRGFSGSASTAGAATATAGTASEGFSKAIATTNISITQQTANLTQNNTQINNVTGSTKKAGEAADKSAGQVEGWIQKYLSVDLAFSILDQLKDRLKEISDAEQALIDKRSTELKSNKPIVVRYGVSEAAAEAMVQDVTLAAPVTREQARASILAAGDAGVDPTKRGTAGDAFTKDLAKAAGLYDLSPDTLSRLARVDVQRGGGSAASLDELIAKMIAAAPKGADPNQFIGAAVSNVLPSLARGESIDNSLALYGTLYRQSTSATAAATATRQLRQLADRGTKASDAFFSAKAAELGVTTPAAVDDAEADRLVDQQATRPEDRISDQRKRLATDRRKLDDDTAALERRRKKLAADKRSMPRVKTRDAKQMRIEADEVAVRSEGEHIDDERARIDRQQRDIAASVAKFKNEETARRQQAAYNQLSPQQRLELVVIPSVSSAQTPEDQKAISDATSIRQGDAVFQLGGDGGSSLRSVQAAVGAAKPADFQDRVAQYEATDDASRVRTESQVGSMLVNATDSGDTYAQNLMAKAVAQRQIQARQGGEGFDFSTFTSQVKSIAMSKDKGVNANIAKMLEADIADTQRKRNYLTPHQQVDLDKIAVPFLQDRDSGIDLSADAGLVNLQSYAEAFGAWKKQVDEENARRIRATATIPGAAPAAGKPAVPPATTRPLRSDGSLPMPIAPEAQGPRSDAGDIHYHYETIINNNDNQRHVTHNVGAIFTPDDGFDLPGAWEEAGVVTNRG